MRDFRDLSPASFKGFPFQSDKEEISGGRSIPVHEYVRSESHDTEDMGRKAVKLSKTAYLASDQVDAEASQLFSICTEPGAGMLILPGVDPGMYRCMTVKRSSEKDKMGYVAFTLEFVAAGGDGAFVTPMFDLQAISAAAGLVSLVAGVLDAFQSSRTALAALAGSIAAFADALAPLASKTPEASAVNERMNASLRITTDPVAQVVTLVSGIRDLGASGGASFADWPVAAARVSVVPALTVSPAITAANVSARTASAILSAAIWQEAAVAAVTTPPRVREQVQAMRESIITGSAPVLDRLAASAGIQMHDAVNKTIGLAVAGLDDFALNVAPMALIKTTRSLPSTALAWKLYGDPERAGELVERSASMTPLLMPRELTALAPTAI